MVDMDKGIQKGSAVCSLLNLAIFSGQRVMSAASAEGGLARPWAFLDM
jgi:hypothetical protein